MLTDDDVERAMVKNNVTQEQAMNAVRSWWHSWLMAGDLKRLGEITECRFYYVPYWRILAKINGQVVGDVDHGDEAREMKRDRITADGSMTWTKIAADIGDIGICFLREPGVKTRAYDGNAGPTLDLTVSKQDALAMCLKDIENAVIDRMRVENVINKMLNFVPKNVRLVVYPLWILKYAYRGRIYPVTVDGASGEVVAGRAPGNPLLREICFAVSFVIAFSIIVLTVLGYIYRSDMCCPIIILDVIGVIIVIITYGYYHYGTEIRRGVEKNVYWPDDYLEKHDHSLVIKELELKTISSNRI